ncbi:hypothetical protein PCASD_14610 [Puccinia coronata f. sp. avenae]|uniref:Uncharacterized protein n=1 Tax=Puccinia coronata f. sp. avenae TaxID=200324 RepID=A0A2N5TUL4_9BASI|nr:hypothetical protein PCASD_14610 [Puccinia coronata f. sp. avenae]
MEKIWGWIYGSVTHAVDLAHVEMKDLIKEKLVSELVSKVDEISQRYHQTSQSWKLQENVATFIDFLVLFNLQLLHQLKSDSANLYITEVNNLCTWLIESIKNERNPPYNPSGQKDEIFHGTGITMTDIVDDVVNLLTSSQSNKVIYQLFIPKPEHELQVATMTQGHLVMTQTAMILSASYYKTFQKMKWSRFFQNEERYLSYVSNLQNGQLYSRNNHCGPPKKYMDALELLPWKNDCIVGPNWKNLVLGQQMNNKRFNKWKKRVKPFVSQRPAVVEADVWAKISLIETETKLAEDTIPLTLALEKFKPSFTNKPLSPLSQMYRDQKISVDEVTQFAKLVWVLNSRLIEAFGYKSGEALPEEEQTDLQNHLFNILNLRPGNHEEVIENLSGDFDQDTRAEERMVSNLIVSSLMCQDNTEINIFTSHRTDHTVRAHKAKKVEAAVKMILLHFRQGNHAKWLDVFAREDGFIAVWEGMSRRLTSTRSFNPDSYHNIRAINLLPWKKPLIISGTQRYHLSRFFNCKRGKKLESDDT